jgi:acetyl esterase/lipase
MKKIARILCYLSGYLSLLYLVQFPAERAGQLRRMTGRSEEVQALGKTTAIFMFITIEIPKLLAGAFSPFIGLAGAAGAVLVSLRSDPAALLAGLMGTGLSIRHIQRVTAPQPGFLQAFGKDWEDRIPPTLRNRMAHAPYRFPKPEPPSPGGSCTRDIAYALSSATGDPLLCDLWQPPPEIPRSGLALLYFHGSAWQGLDKGMAQQDLFRRLAGQGHVIMDAAYSLAPRTDLFGIVGDVKRAIAWIKTNAAEYDVNPSRVVLMGSAGGGHLALLAAYTPNHPAFQPVGLHADTSVRGVISIDAPTDLMAHFEEYRRMGSGQPQYSHEITREMLPWLHDRTSLDRLLTQLRLFPAYRYGNFPGGALLLIGLLGGTPWEMAEAYRLVSPLFHARANCPPTLQIFAEHNAYFSPAHGRRLHRALREHGATSVYIELPGTSHGFDHVFTGISPAGQAAAYSIERFLALMA